MKKTIIYIFILYGCNFYSQNKLTNQIIWGTGTFYPEQISDVNSMNDGKHFTSLDIDYDNGTMQINKYTYANYEKISTILSSDDVPGNSIDNYQFNHKESQVLIATSMEPIYRHSTESNYYIYDIKSNELAPLTDFKQGKQRLAEFSPTGHHIAFVRENNIFIKDLNTNEEIVVTEDGKINEVINGATDWVYEEEFSFDKGFEWSSDGSKIAYYSFYEGDVKEFQMEMYGSLYPTHHKFKYPKAGEANSVISINVYELNNNRTTPFDIGTDPDIYIPRIKWTSDPDILSVQKMNRLQNQLKILTGKFKSDRPNNSGVTTQIIYTEESSTYIDIHDNLTFLNDNEHFLWTSEKDGYNHIYKININNGNAVQITSGNWDVTEVYGMSEQKESIFFQAAKEHPTQREVYTIDINGKELKKLSTKAGTNHAEFSNSFDYYLHFNTSANTPHYITLHQLNNSDFKVLKDNNALLDRMNQFNLTKKEFFQIKDVNENNLNAWMIKPPDFNKKKEYPLLMYVYGGPGINTVNDEWEWMNYFWWQMLAQNGYIVVSVDARGTGFRGKDFKHSTYLQLGKYETEDQILAAKKLGEFKYIDKNRIGIFGWSYGGYMSSLCITKGADVFSTAIAVAPVTNWRYYDNIYTERFMRTPQENGDNYDVNSPINHVDKLKGNYLLIHGTADDNVHFQNALEMVNALVNANKQFDFFAYPDRNHGIYGGYTRWHLYDMMTNYLIDNL